DGEHRGGIHAAAAHRGAAQEPRHGAAHHRRHRRQRLPRLPGAQRHGRQLRLHLRLRPVAQHPNSIPCNTCIFQLEQVRYIYSSSLLVKCGRVWRAWSEFGAKMENSIRVLDKKNL
uniref:Uncharacterized protein n=1 Tax=Oryza brachyantha TaxID=4533 RepID=J3MMU6_ORYBR